jgi:RNA polymerase sigma-70 factor (ECF subfamily)
MDAQLLTIAEQAIEAMPPRRREVLKLHRFEHLTYDEIAIRLSVSRSTVKKDLADAIAEVAEALARKSGQGVDGLADRK